MSVLLWPADVYHKLGSAPELQLIQGPHDISDYNVLLPHWQQFGGCVNITRILLTNKVHKKTVNNLSGRHRAPIPVFGDEL